MTEHIKDKVGSRKKSFKFGFDSLGNEDAIES